LKRDNQYKRKDKILISNLQIKDRFNKELPADPITENRRR